MQHQVPVLVLSYISLWLAKLLLADLGLLDAGREAVDEEAVGLGVLAHRLQQQVCHFFLERWK